MPKPTKRKGIPEAPALISQAIDQLAEIRDTMWSLAKRSKATCSIIIAHGSSHNDKWRAYVAHHRGGLVSYRQKARDSVTLRPMKEVKKG